MAANPTVLHGIPMSGISTEKPPTGNWAALFHSTEENGLSCYNNDGDEWQPFEYVPFTYDVSGGASGTVAAHALSGAVVPAGCTVIDGIVDVITTFTSAGDLATIALHFESANDIVSAIAINNGANPWDAGLQNIVPAGTAATAKKATADRTVTATVGVEALTAGKLRGFLRCVRGTAT